MSSSEAAAGAVGYPDHLREEVEAYLAGLRFADEPAAAGLEEAMRYSLLAGGKRIRPVLALATANALGREAEEVLPLAAANGSTSSGSRRSASAVASASTGRMRLPPASSE